MSLLFSRRLRQQLSSERKGFFCLSAVNSGVWHVYGPRSVLQMQCTALLLCARKTQASQAPRWRYYKLRVGNLFKVELLINKLHGLSPSGGLVSPSGGFASLFFDQVGYFASIKLCQALSRQGAIIKIPVVRCHYLLCSSAQWTF